VTNRGIAVLAVRLLALYLFVQALMSLPGVYAALIGAGSAADDVHYWLLVGAELSPVVMGLLLWAAAGPLASMLLPRRTAAPEPVTVRAEGWYALAFAAVGLLVTIEALPQLLEVAAAAHRRALALEPIEPELATALTAAALRVFLGLAALFGSRGFANLIARLRTSGLEHAVVRS
jgi:hypothetical protein